MIETLEFTTKPQGTKNRVASPFPLAFFADSAAFCSTARMNRRARSSKAGAIRRGDGADRPSRRESKAAELVAARTDHRGSPRLSSWFPRLRFSFVASREAFWYPAGILLPRRVADVEFRIPRGNRVVRGRCVR